MNKMRNNEIQFVDQTLRDAQQSMWGNLMPTDMILPIAHVIDQVGYKAIAIGGGRCAVIAKRYLHEDFFERLRLLAKKIAKTPLRSSFATWSPFGFGLEPVATSELWIKLLISYGIREFWFVNYQNLSEKERYLAGVAKAGGAKIAASLIYTVSPVHTNEHWAKRVRRMVETSDIDIIQTEDTGGVLTPQTTPGWIRAIKKESKGLPIEFHSHCTTGAAPMCYVEALKEGLRTMHTAVLPLANGPSLPSIENTIKNAQIMGYTTNLDMEALKVVSGHFTKEAKERGLRLGAPVEYDLSQSWHQIPGGMMGTLRNQLAEIKQEHRLQEVLEETGQVRREFGYPVMGTPYSQFVGAQALFNITAGERYKIVSDEVIRYMLGHYGEIDGPVNPNVKDKILSSPKAKKWLKWKEPEVTVKDMRQLEPRLSDEELLLKIADPEGEFKDKLRALYGWA